MKIDKQLPAIGAIDPQERRQPLATERRARQPQRRELDTATAEARARKSTSFSLQLNQQLSSMQSAENYLADLHGRLSQLKLSLGRELGAATPGSGAEAIGEQLEAVGTLLGQRRERSAEALDADFRLRLNEPVRSRFTLAGLSSPEAIRESGAETLVFRAGRQLAEPVAVVLDEAMSDEQILRRFNASLGQAGIRAELDDDGQLRFSARESLWDALKGELAVRGEGKLFAGERFQRVDSHQEQLLELPAEPALDSFNELRQVLDKVVAALDRIANLRDQLGQRQKEIREFLARQADRDEKQWALDFSRSVFNLMQRSPSSYAAVTQTVAAQATLSRFTVVSLLS
ncbi:hypothetical protein QX25_16405 [Stutzerimonas stutzeri]|nr:hypothetical protein QX25_16405 [Stutzerimonas stutzeri]